MGIAFHINGQKFDCIYKPVDSSEFNKSDRLRLCSNFFEILSAFVFIQLLNRQGFYKLGINEYLCLFMKTVKEETSQICVVECRACTKCRCYLI
jgi:hypothetical protein